MDIYELDKSNLRQLIIDYPNQLLDGQKFAEGVSVSEKEYSNLIVCGMGGSALPAELLFSHFAHGSDKPLEIPYYAVRGYSLPRQANSDSLVFISSYSGNTEETVSCFEEALKIGATIVAFSAGGKIEEIAQENQVPHIKFSIEHDNFQPRYATTYSFMAMLQVLTNSNLCGNIEKLPNIDSKSLEVQGEKLAQKTKGKIPVIYTSDRFKSLARLCKIKLNENSNTQAFWNYFPELNHNEFEGFSMPRSDFVVTIFRSKHDLPRIQQRMEITKKFYNEWEINCEIVDIKGGSYLEEMLNGMVLGDWMAYYLALEYGIDPSPSDIVGKFKKALG